MNKKLGPFRHSRLSLASQSNRFQTQTTPYRKSPCNEGMLCLDDSFIGSVDLEKVEKAYWDSKKKPKSESEHRGVSTEPVSPLLYESSSDNCHATSFETPSSGEFERVDNIELSPVQPPEEAYYFPSPILGGTSVNKSVTVQRNVEQNTDKYQFASSQILGESNPNSAHLPENNVESNNDGFDNGSVLADFVWDEFEASAYKMNVSCTNEIITNTTVNQLDECERVAGIANDGIMEDVVNQVKDEDILDYTVYVNNNNAVVPCTDQTIKETSTELKQNTTGNRNNTLFKALGLSELDWSELFSEEKKNITLVPSKQSNVDFNEQMKERLLGNARKQASIKISLTDETLKKLPEDNSFYGLPEKVFKLIQKYKGIKDLYDWQKKCLSLPAVQNHSNLLYVLPTSGGKTLVAEILILKELFVYHKNAIFILPFVSIVQEKVRALSPFGLELNFFIEEYASNRGAYPPRVRRKKQSVYIATIEKALGLVNSLMSENRLDEIGLVVVDELHLIGENLRGATLETLITKVLFSREPIQIISMTATIGNPKELGVFLQADTFSEDFRPVELKEYVKCGNQLFLINRNTDQLASGQSMFSLTRTYEVDDQAKKSGDPDLLGVLVMEVVPQESVLLFCPTRKNCENVSILICENMPKDLVDFRREEKLGLYRALLAEGNGKVCPTLKRTLPYGVAYHHSGLTTAERRLLEEAFLAKTISVICCTSTLAAGVNLPARRVILRAPLVGNSFIDLSRYKQMIGRAGRTGLDETGESILICGPGDVHKVRQMLSSGVESAMSQLDTDNEGQGVSLFVLSSIELLVTPNLSTLRQLLASTLLHVQAQQLGVNINQLTNNAVKQLVEGGGVTVTNPPEGETCDDSDGFTVVLPKSKQSKMVYPSSGIQLSSLGKAAVKAGQTLPIARRLYEDLKKAQQNCVLVSHLHLLFLVTPYSLCEGIKPNGDSYYEAYMGLSKGDLHTAEIIGITEAAAMSIRRLRTPKGVSKDIVDRFYLALILYDLWQEKSVWDVAVKYQIMRGQVYTLMTTVPSFASAVLRFSEEMDEFWCFKNLLSEMTTRLAHFCCVELQPLMELPSVKIGRARQLYQAGFRTIRDVAKAEPIEIARSLDHMPRKVAHEIVSAARLLLLAKAETLQEEAEVVLEGIALKTKCSF